MLTITGTISTTDAEADLGVEILLDHKPVFSADHVKQDTKFLCEVNDEDYSNHCIQFVLKNKKPEHTQLDAQGNIVQDARLIIKDVAFDEIVLGQTFIDNTVYTHDFNGTQETVQERFYGEMGCNGSVALEFTSPVYIWLLENQ
jgi:hypothetical protein